MDDIQANLEERLRELRDTLTNTEENAERLKILSQILSVEERLARAD
jgi:CHASE3 domain sensor protein